MIVQAKECVRMGNAFVLLAMQESLVHSSNVLRTVQPTGCVRMECVSVSKAS